MTSIPVWRKSYRDANVASSASGLALGEMQAGWKSPSYFVPGRVGNQLQAVLWHEAIHLMRTGVASGEDVDTAVWA